jgi:sugar lactone lactonase YvrE
MLRQFVTAVVCLTALCRAATAADMQYPLAIAAVDNGPLFIVDRNLPGVWKFTDGKLEMYFEGSKKFRTPLNAARCAAIDHQGKLLVGDTSTREIYRFDDDGKPQPLTKGANQGIGMPMALTVNRQGTIFVCDLETQWIYKMPPEGGTPERFVQPGPCRGITIDDQDRLWVVLHAKNQILRITPDAKIEVVLDKWPFEFPHHIVLDKELNAYVVDGYAKAVWKIDPTGKASKLFEGPPLDNPVGIAWHGGKLLICDPRAKGVYELSQDGKLSPVVTAPPDKPQEAPKKSDAKKDSQKTTPKKDAKK